MGSSSESGAMHYGTAVSDGRSIPPTRLRPEPIDPDTTIGFRYAVPGAGHLHRIGGEPSFRLDP